MRLFYFVVLLFFTCHIYSQKSANIKFGVANSEEVAMTHDPSDSTAEAVLLYENQTVHFEWINSISIHKAYHARVKILKASGLDRGNISLPYHATESGETERVKEIEGFVYNMVNGEVVSTPIPPSAIFEEKVSGTYFIKKIIAPNVKEGSVIEYRYKYETPFAVSDSPQDWFFQGDIPFKWSELNVIVPGSINYRMQFSGYLPMHINTSEPVSIDYGFNRSSTKYRFVVKDAPAFKNETFIPSRRDYMSKMEFELTGYSLNSRQTNVFSESWKDLYQNLNDNDWFGQRLRAGNYLKDIVKSLSPINDSTEKIQAAFKYVTDNFTWNGVYGKYSPDDLSTVFENKKGNCAGINFLLVVLLRELGIEANPAIISTRGNGEFKEDYPMLDKFNYVITQARVNGKDLLMDAASPMTVPGFLPQHCLNAKACVIEKHAARIISVVPQKSVCLTTIEAELDSTGKQLSGTYSMLTGTHKAYGYRQFIKLNDKGEEGLTNYFKLLKPEWEIDAFKMENTTDGFKHFKLNFNFKEELQAQSDQMIYINGLMTENTKENPFKSKDRYYPVSFPYPEQETTVITLKIPANYTVVKQPKNSSLALQDKSGKFSYVTELKDNVLKIVCQLSIDRCLYTPTEYHSLKEFYAIMIQKQAEQIVLKKVSH